MENNKDTVPQAVTPAPLPKLSFFSKFHYKLLFVFSIIFGLLVLWGLVSNSGTSVDSYQRGVLTFNDLYVFFFSVVLLLSFISLMEITYSYIKNRTQANGLSDACVISMIGIVVSLLLLTVGFFALLVLSGGVLALIPGFLSSLVPFQLIYIALGIYFLAYSGLVFSYTKEHTTKKLKVFLLWFVVLLVIASWFMGHIITNSAVGSKFVKSSVAVSPIGSTVGWLTYSNPQIGLSFMYPPSWPTPSASGGANPRVTVPNLNGNPNQELLQIFIGQTGPGVSTAVSCDSCVVIPFDQAAQYYGSEISAFSPEYKMSSIKLYGKTYTLLSNTLSDGWTTSATIVVPNEISPSDYAIVSSGGSVDLNTLYFIVSSLHFSLASTTYVQPPASTSPEASAATTSPLSASILPNQVDCGSANYPTGTAEASSMDNSVCFNQQLSMCNPATMSGTVSDQTRTFRILGKSGSECVVTQTLSGSSNPKSNWQLNCYMDSTKPLNQQNMSKCSEQQ